MGCRIRRPNSAQVRPDFSRARVHLLVSSTGRKKERVRRKILKGCHDEEENEVDAMKIYGCRSEWKRTCNVKASSSLQKLVLISRNARCSKDPKGEFDITLPLFPLLRGTAT